MTSRVCIVATVREPVTIIESFIRYHLAIGVERLFLFFDDPHDEAIAVARGYSQVTAIPSGVHCFSTTQAHPQRSDCPGSPVILHYINCGFDAYLRKYQRLGSDSWLGTPIPFQFYIDSRRLTGDRPALTNLYQHEVLFDDSHETEYLLGKGILARVVVPSNLLAE